MVNYMSDQVNHSSVPHSNHPNPALSIHLLQVLHSPIIHLEMYTIFEGILDHVHYTSPSHIIVHHWYSQLFLCIILKFLTNHSISLSSLRITMAIFDDIMQFTHHTK